ncbi:MAG: hypothetical protein JNJ71_08985 [Rubrivivax sp.]|nr:hypothetical protein [Rubrivivax sp.]
MIKLDIKLPDTRDLMRAAMQAIERSITDKAKRAAARHGGVTVKFDRKLDGTIRSVNFQGSEAAVQAARSAITD